MQVVERGREAVAVGQLAVRPLVPPEVAVQAEHLQRLVRRLPAAHARVALGRHRNWSGRVELPGQRGLPAYVALLHGRGPRVELVRDRPGHDRRVVAVRDDVVGQHPRGEPLEARVLQGLRRHLVDGDLRPDEEPVAVGQLVHVRAERVMRADGGGAYLLREAHEQLLALVGNGAAGCRVVLVHEEPAEVNGRPVQAEAAAFHGDRADAAVELVGAGAAGANRAEAHVVQIRVGRRPRVWLRDGDSPHERRLLAGPDRPRAEGDRLRPVPARDVRPHRVRRVVVHGHAIADRGRAGAAGKVRAHLHPAEVEPADAPQVDVAEDAAVVPPAAVRRALDGEPRGRQVLGARSVVDAHEQPVHRAAALHTARPQLPRQVRAGVAAQEAPVEPDGRPVSDVVEVEEPGGGGPRGRHEVLAVPGHAPGHALVARVVRVPGVRHAHARPPLAPVAAHLPVASVQQVAAARAVVVPRRLGWHRGGGSGTGSE